MNRHNVPPGPTPGGGVVLGRVHIYLMGRGVYTVGGKEKQMMTRMVAVCDLDLPVMQGGNEVVVAAAAAAVERTIGRLMSELASYHNHRHLC
jgi:hypothetical protein